MNRHLLFTFYLGFIYYLHFIWVLNESIPISLSNYYCYQYRHFSILSVIGFWILIHFQLNLINYIGNR